MIEELKPYSSHRATGVYWLPRVPAHWEIVRSKHVFAERTELARAGDVQLSATQAYGVIPQAEFERRVGRRVVRISMHLDKRSHVEKGDFVISMRSFQGGLERAWASGAIRSSYVVLRPAREVELGYFAHLFKAQPYIKALQATGNFIRDGQDLTFGNFSRVDLPVPPRDEQLAIGRFLDHANRRIDQFIRTKKKLIALLNEQKQAIIHRAVTRGLDPNVKLKDSGVPWLGEVPRDWEVSRFRHMVRRIDQGVSPLASGFLAEGDSWGVLKSGCVNGGIFRETEHKQLSRDFVIDPRIAVSVGDVLVSRACGSPRLVGSTARVSVLHYRLILSDKTFRPVFRDNVEPDFAVYAMNSAYYRQQVGQAISGAEGLANNLPLSSLRDFVFPLPRVAEQRRIVECVDADLALIAPTLIRCEKELELAREYRTRLISDVVTGQLDVSAAAAALPVVAPEVAPADSDGDETDIEDGEAA